MLGIFVELSEQRLIGLLMCLTAWFWRRSGAKAIWWMMTIGLAMIVSDLMHHFLVLWPITGDPKFDLVYPDQ